MIVQKWMKKGARVLADGQPGEFWDVVTDPDSGDIAYFNIVPEGERYSEKFLPEQVKRLKEAKGLPPILSIKSLKEKNYETVPINQKYIDLIGEIESHVVMMAYGASGSGKSVWVMEFADHYADSVGKVFYNSHEESHNKTMKRRAIAYNINSPNLFVAQRYSFDQMMIKLKTTYYRLIIIDSVQFMRFTFEQLEALQKFLKKRSVAILMVSFGKGLGVTKGADDLLHAADVKLHFDQGLLTVISRYLDQPLEQRLFTPKKAKKAHAPTLF